MVVAGASSESVSSESLLAQERTVWCHTFSGRHLHGVVGRSRANSTNQSTEMPGIRLARMAALSQDSKDTWASARL